MNHLSTLWILCRSVTRTCTSWTIILFKTFKRFQISCSASRSQNHQSKSNISNRTSSLVRSSIIIHSYTSLTIYSRFDWNRVKKAPDFLTKNVNAGETWRNDSLNSGQKVLTTVSILIPTSSWSQYRGGFREVLDSNLR